MVVVAVFQQNVVGRAGPLIDRPQQAHVAQQVEGAIDGHAADAGLPAHALGQFVGRQVAAAVGQRAKDEAAGRRQAVAALGQRPAQTVAHDPSAAG